MEADDNTIERGTTNFAMVVGKTIIFGTDCRSIHGRSKRIVTEDAEKVKRITPHIFVSMAGSYATSNKLWSAMINRALTDQQNNIVTTVASIAEFGKEHLERNSSDTWPGPSTFLVMGMENGEPTVFCLLDRKNLKEKMSVERCQVAGAGGRFAMEVLEKYYDINMSESNATFVANHALLHAALNHAYTGGSQYVFSIDSDGMHQLSYKSNPRMYLENYEDFSETHLMTFFMLSRGRVGNDDVIEWFSSGDHIEPVDVKFVHSIGEVGPHFDLRRVVIKENGRAASEVIEEIKQVCEEYGCRDTMDLLIGDLPCFQIEHEQFYFAASTKEMLSRLLALNLDY